MSKYHHIIQKLEKFYKKFYINELLKGAILFFAIGLLYLLLTVSLEYFFWLGKNTRLILFWSFIIVEIALFCRFLLFPLFKLFKISKGITYEEAAKMIGKHFPEVNDKLLNILQLKKAGEGRESELLLASIDQKAEELQPVPFQFAVDFKSSIPYLKYAAIPIFIVLLIWLSGKLNMFSESYSRVVNYQEVYEPPAPFSFHILNTDLISKENEEFDLRLQTQGNLVPQNVMIHFNGESYLMQNKTPGEFSYKFSGLNENTEFYLTANNVRSRAYELNVVKIPKLLDFNMLLEFPAYLGKKNQQLKGTGNVTIPEGTKINWELKTESTDEVKLALSDSLIPFLKQKNTFKLQEKFHKNTDYQITTSNRDLNDYEKLSYHIKIIKDQYPEIEVDMKRDTISEEALYFHGRISDDYALTKLQMVFYPSREEHRAQSRRIQINPGNFDEFLYAFPDTIQLKKGTSYEVYFEVFDNDGVNGAKRKRSEIFTYRKLTDDEQEEKQLKNQKDAIDGMQQSLDKMKESQESFKEIDQLRKEKEQMNYNDRKKVEEFMKQMRQENDMMQEYTEKMKAELDQFQKDKKDESKEALMERMQRNEEKLKENEKLLEELEKYRDKIGQEEMNKKVEEMAKNKQAQNRSLEELLEQTKRYYVQKKAERLAEDLKKLSKEQDALSEKNQENTSDAQERLNKKFDQIREELEYLQQENIKLRKPMDLGRDEAKERDVSRDQEAASDNLEEAEKQDAQDGNSENQENSPKSDAIKNQKSAAEKMRQLSQGMQSGMQMGAQDQMEEDIEALRQILDNLIIFSFSQEDLMLDFEGMQNGSPDFGNRLKHQHVLRENFKHVDDSLYALALRNPAITEQITTKLVDVDFNIGKSLEDLAKFKLPTGTMYQQYVLTGANDLANLLDNAMQNMEMMMMQMQGEGEGEGMPSPGSGGGEKFQLPDIIQGQEDLMNQGEEAGGDEEGDQDGEGQEGDDGSDSGEGNQGDEGEGQQGEDGEGSDGSGGSDGSQYGDGDLPSEEMNSAELYEIFKQQQKLRFQLEDLMRREHLGVEGRRLAEDMERVEQELLRNGFSEKSKEMMMHMKEQMIKLHEATYQQDEEDQREANTNYEEFKNTKQGDFDKIKDYFQTIEILNRQSLPLQPNYKQMVQDYFSK